MTELRKNYLLDKDGNVIDPATEDKQDNIVTLLEQGVDTFIFNASLGNIPGVNVTAFGGNNPSIGAGETESLWSQGGLIPDLATGTQLYASSTDDDDTQTFTVLGYNKSGSTITRETVLVTLDGQTQVALTGLLWKVAVISNITPTATEGDVYIAEADDLTGGIPDTTSKIHGKVLKEKQAESIGTYVTPTGKRSYTFQQDEAIGKAQDMEMRFKNRLPGTGWLEVFPFPAFQNSPNRFQVGFIQDAGEELRMDASSVGGGASVTATYKVIEFDI